MILSSLLISCNLPCFRPEVNSRITHVSQTHIYILFVHEQVWFRLYHMFIWCLSEQSIFLITPWILMTVVLLLKNLNVIWSGLTSNNPRSRSGPADRQMGWTCGHGNDGYVQTWCLWSSWKIHVTNGSNDLHSFLFLPKIFPLKLKYS